MNKKKLFPFLVGNAFIGVSLVFVVILNIFDLFGIARLIVSALAIAAGGLSFSLLTSWAGPKERPIYIGEDGQTDSVNTLGNCSLALETYLRENKTTRFFEDKLAALSERIEAFRSRRDNIKDVIVGRFGAAGFSYGKFSAPVIALQDYLVKQVNNLLGRMRVFNAEEYERRIAEFTRANRIKEATDYKEIEKEHQDYAEKTIAAFDDAVLKLDRLALEISKLNESDVDKAMSILHDLDAVIKDTALYK